MAENGDVTELRVRAGNNEEITAAERRRVDASVLALFVFLEWQYLELGDDLRTMTQVREVQGNNFSIDASYGRVWEERKQSFDPAFVQWMQENVLDFLSR